MKCDRRVIFLCDFNCVCSTEDRSKNSATRDKSALLLSTMTGTHCLEDVGLTGRNGVTPRYTHFQRECHARLDRAYVSLELVPLISSYEVKHVPFSDHSLVMFTVGVKKKMTNFNWDLWKFNTKLLNDEKFVESVEGELEKLLSCQTNSYSAMWEEVKINIKLMATEKGSILRYDQGKKNELKAQLVYLTEIESTQPGTFLNEIKDMKN